MSDALSLWDDTPAAAQPSPSATNAAALWDSTPVQSAAQSTPNTSGLGSDTQNFLAGAGKAVVDLARGAKQLSDIPAQWLEKKFPTISAWSQAQGMPSAAASAAATNADVAQSRALDAPLMATKAGMAGNIAGNIATTLLPLGAAAQYGRGGQAARALINPSTYKAAAASGALSGALQPVTGDETHLQNAAVGGALGVAGNAAVNTIGRVAQPISNVLSAAQAKAVKVMDDAGIPLDAAQRTGSSFLGKIRSSFSDNPFTSGAQSDLVGAQQAAYNKAVLGTIGEDAATATPDVMQSASNRINGVFNDILSRNNVQMTDPVVSRIADIQRAATEEEKAPVANIANRLINSVGDDGSVPGQAAYNIKKDLDRLSSSSDTTLAYHARQLRSTLMDSINGSLSPSDQAAFAEARNQFSNMKKIEPAIDRTGGGNISAPKLANVMAQKANRNASIYGRGDQQLVDLAQAGNMLLPDKTPNSGSTARAWMQIGVPALIGGTAGGVSRDGQGNYSFDLENAAKGAIGLAAIPRAAQYLMNSGASSGYLSNGMRGSLTPLRNMLQLPQTNNMVGGTLKRLPQAFSQAK